MLSMTVTVSGAQVGSQLASDLEEAAYAFAEFARDFDLREEQDLRDHLGTALLDDNKAKARLREIAKVLMEVAGPAEG